MLRWFPSLADRSVEPHWARRECLRQDEKSAWVIAAGHFSDQTSAAGDLLMDFSPEFDPICSHRKNTAYLHLVIRTCLEREGALEIGRCIVLGHGIRRQIREISKMEDSEQDRG